MPLLVTGTDYVPVFHLGAVGGNRPPFWDQHDEFGDTNMLVVKPEEGASLARALGRHWMVLMKRHGVTVAGTSVRDCVFRSVFSARNAEYQVRAMTHRHASRRCRPAKSKLAGGISTKTTGLTRVLGILERCGLPRPAACRRRSGRRQSARPSRAAKPRQAAQKQAPIIWAFPAAGPGVECRPRAVEQAKHREDRR